MAPYKTIYISLYSTMGYNIWRYRQGVLRGSTAHHYIQFYKVSEFGQTLQRCRSGKKSLFSYSNGAIIQLFVQARCGFWHATITDHYTKSRDVSFKSVWPLSRYSFLCFCYLTKGHNSGRKVWRTNGRPDSVKTIFPSPVMDNKSFRQYACTYVALINDISNNV